MRRAVLSFLLLASGCTDGAPAADTGAQAVSPRAWTARSADGRVALAQAPADAGCRLEAKVAGATAWQAEGCAATSYDLVFVAPDGERWLVLYPQPERQGSDWSSAEVAVLRRRGEVVRRVTGDELVAAARIADMRGEASWLRGIGAGAPAAAAPRYAEAGDAVVVQVADGATLTLGFDGAGVPGRRAPVAAAAPAPRTGVQDDDALWSWQDEKGVTHYQRLSEVPREARALARPVTGTISTIGSDRPELTPEEEAQRRLQDRMQRDWEEQNKKRPASGLSSAERKELEARRAADLERKRRLGAAFLERVQGRVDVGPNLTIKKTGAPKQNCTRRGDILECRDAPMKCRKEGERTICEQPE